MNRTLTLLASALTLVASEGGAVRGGIVLGLFGVGAATPLVAVAYASRRGFQSVRDKVLMHGDRVKKNIRRIDFSGRPGYCHRRR